MTIPICLPMGKFFGSILNMVKYFKKKPWRFFRCQMTNRKPRGTTLDQKSQTVLKG